MTLVTDVLELTRRRADRRVPRRPALAGRGRQGGAGAHRARRPGPQRVLPRRRGGGARAAREVGGALAQRRAAGPLDGVPVGVKDIFPTRGWPTLRGSARSTRPGRGTTMRPPWPAAPARRRPARQDHHARVRLEGRRPTARSPASRAIPGTRDARPAAPAAAAAAAVAAGHGPARARHRRRRLDPHPGCVLRRSSASSPPSAACRPGPSPFGTVAHVGPMARTVADPALLLDVHVRARPARLARRCRRPARSFRDGLDDGVRGLRVAFSPDLGYVDRRSGDRGAGRGGGGRARRPRRTRRAADPGFADPRDVFETLWSAGAASGRRSRRPPPEGSTPACRAGGAGRCALAADYLAAMPRATRSGGA